MDDLGDQDQSSLDSTVTIDMDIMAWFRYQSTDSDVFINAVLRQYMQNNSDRQPDCVLPVGEPRSGRATLDTYISMRNYAVNHGSGVRSLQSEYGFSYWGNDLDESGKKVRYRIYISSLIRAPDLVNLDSGGETIRCFQAQCLVDEYYGNGIADLPG